MMAQPGVLDEKEEMVIFLFNSSRGGVGQFSFIGHSLFFLVGGK
jgi:hypothetical protein